MSTSLPQFLDSLAAETPGWGWQLLDEAVKPQPQQNSFAERTSTRGSQVFPLRDSTGLQVGQLLGTPHADTPLPSHLQRVIQLLLPLLAELLATRSKLRTAEQLALADPLTGLPNRRAWEQALAREEQRCRRANHPAAIVCLDLDRLKEQNDSAGHAAGDELLRVTADCLRRSIRAHDHAARLGGDEFAVLLVECAGECVPQIIERLRTSLAAASVAATIGWAARDKDCDLHATWRKADQVLIAAKK